VHSGRAASATPASTAPLLTPLRPPSGGRAFRRERRAALRAGRFCALILRPGAGHDRALQGGRGLCRAAAVGRYAPFSIAGVSAMRVLVTGGAGFIGSAVCHALLARGACVINVDKLTYAANPRSLEAIAREEHYAFERLDICDRAAMDAVLAK